MTEVHYEEIIRRLERIETRLLGNGQEGLVTTMGRFDERLQDVEEDTKNNKGMVATAAAAMVALLLNIQSRLWE